MTNTFRNERDIAIVGVAESDEMGTVPNKSSLQHHAEAASNALEDAGLSLADVNGVFTAGFSSLATAEYLEKVKEEKKDTKKATKAKTKKGDNEE